MSAAELRVPKVGDTYLDDTRSRKGRKRKIVEVGMEYEDGGYEVLVDGMGWSDCYWSERRGMFYWCSDEYAASRP